MLCECSKNKQEELKRRNFYIKGHTPVIEKITFTLLLEDGKDFKKKIRGKAIQLQKVNSFTKAGGPKTSSHFTLETQTEIVQVKGKMVGKIAQSILLLERWVRI